jgi:hypothetical protein
MGGKKSLITAPSRRLRLDVDDFAPLLFLALLLVSARRSRLAAMNCAQLPALSLPPISSSSTAQQPYDVFVGVLNPIYREISSFVGTSPFPPKCFVSCCAPFYQPLISRI